MLSKSRTTGETGGHTPRKTNSREDNALKHFARPMLLLSCCNLLFPPSPFACTNELPLDTDNTAEHLTRGSERRGLQRGTSLREKSARPRVAFTQLRCTRRNSISRSLIFLREKLATLMEESSLSFRSPLDSYSYGIEITRVAKLLPRCWFPLLFFFLFISFKMNGSRAPTRGGNAIAAKCRPVSSMSSVLAYSTG